MGLTLPIFLPTEKRFCMPTLTELTTSITDVSKNHYIQTASCVSLASRINEAVTTISAGMRMPDQTISPPLPELHSSIAVATTVNAYASLPATYQRNVFYIVDKNGDELFAPVGGDYYSFVLFLRDITEKDLSGTGSITNVCVKGNRLYYQGIPSVSENITVMFYRKPVEMTLGSDTPDGIPEQFQTRLIKHYVGRQLANEMVDGLPDKANYHENEFILAMRDLIDFIGIDAGPEYYNSSSSFVDRGVCD